MSGPKKNKKRNDKEIYVNGSYWGGIYPYSSRNPYDISELIDKF